MSREIIESNEAPAAIGPYSQAVAVGEGRTLYASGQIALDPQSGQMVGEGDVAAQTERVLQNLEAVLRAGGMGFADVVKTTIYLADLGHFGIVNEIYGARFGEKPPARATVQVAALPKGALVEIDAVAVAS